ncbi:phage repressor protein [Marinilactibacillus psychrotolerans]|uniref:Phage repressor protein n=1 Tax=Marinilactibacillus psychrotolerans TaxID=191770 RepID=A0A5R9C2V5_9LACT|nr:BRO family protein [Marinilactibacillus psychrotolerans]TLQ07082.1 phage repressor protein [Marinilactibacillus psychrotolerans]
MKTENWNGHEIRFVSIDKEWHAIAKDVTDALGFSQAKDAIRKMPKKYLGKVYKVPTTSISKVGHETSVRSKYARKSQDMITLTEKGLYRLIMRSNKKEAEEFQDWVFEVIKTLREQTGLEGFQVFRLMDKEHQKEAMSYLSHVLKHPVRVNFIKANTIANKAVSLAHGHSKMLKKADMTPQMLVDRQKILEEIVDLMSVQDKYNLDISISQTIYNKDKQTN